MSGNASLAAPPAAAAPYPLWVVVPAYREAPRIRGVIERLTARLPGAVRELAESAAGRAASWQVVVVDDGSPDGTREALAGLPVWTLRHPVNCGQGAALRTGIEFALARGAAAIVTFDADGQHQPEDLPALLAPLLRGEADVALGSRFLGHTVRMPFSRRLLLRAALLFTRLVTRIRVTDVHNGLRAFSRSAAEQIQLTQPRMAHASEILDEIVRRRLRFVEVPVTVVYGPETLAKGQSAWGAARILAHLVLGRCSS